MGFVRDRSDPDKLGRVRAHVPAIMGVDNVPSAWLDWALPSSPGLAVPPMGAPVWIEFEGGFITNPIYSWGWLRGDTADTSEAPAAGKEAQDETWLGLAQYKASTSGPPLTATIAADPAKASPPAYPYNKVFQSEGGIIIELDDTPDKPRLRVYHPGGGGSTMLLASDGTLQVRTEHGAIAFEAGGDCVFTLKPGSTFKVIYPQSGGIAIGPTGVVITGPQVSIMGRTVLRNRSAI